MRKEKQIDEVPVVIPWRGFRCFTLVPKDYKDAPLTYKVVIPWRGFRCFTPFISVNVMVGLITPGL